MPSLSSTLRLLLFAFLFFASCIADTNSEDDSRSQSEEEEEEVVADTTDADYIDVDLETADPNQPRSLHEVTFCSIGVGRFGAAAAQLAISKGFKLVAAFTRYSHRTQDAGTTLGLGYPLGFNVSSIKRLESVLAETNPMVCIDATQAELEKVYSHVSRVLQAGVSVVSLSEQLLYANSLESWKITQLLATLNATAIANDAVLIGSGLADGPILPVVNAVAASMDRVSRIEIRVYMNARDNKELKVSKMYGAGLTPAEYEKKFEVDSKYSVVDELQIWSKNIVEALADELQFQIVVRPRAGATHLSDLQVFSRNECFVYEEDEDGHGDAADVFSAALGRNIELGQCLGTQITTAGFCANGMMLYVKVFVGLQVSDSDALEYVFYEDEKQQETNEPPPMTVSIESVNLFEMAINPVVHRLATALYELQPGYYTTRNLPTNRYFSNINEYRQPIVGKIQPPPKEKKDEDENEDSDDGEGEEKEAEEFAAAETEAEEDKTEL